MGLGWRGGVGSGWDDSGGEESIPSITWGSPHHVELFQGRQGREGQERGAVDATVGEDQLPQGREGPHFAG